MLPAEHFLCFLVASLTNQVDLVSLLPFPGLEEAPVAMPSMWWPLALDFLALRRSLDSSLDLALDLEPDPAL